MVNDVIHEHRSQQIPLWCGDEYAIPTSKRPVLVENAVFGVCQRRAKSGRALIQQGDQLVGRIEIRKWSAAHEIEAVGLEQRGSARWNIRDMRCENANRSGFLVRLPIPLSGRETLEHPACRCELSVEIDQKE